MSINLNQTTDFFVISKKWSTEINITIFVGNGCNRNFYHTAACEVKSSTQGNGEVIVILAQNSDSAENIYENKDALLKP